MPLEFSKFVAIGRRNMKTNRSVERAISVLMTVCQGAGPLGLTEISRDAGLDKATTLRLLTTLGNADMVRQEGASRRYYPGAGIYNFWPSDIRGICRPHLQSLLDKTQETICLVMPRGNVRVCRDSLEPDRDLRIVAPIGRTLPICVGATGRVLMAFMSDEKRTQIFAQGGLQESSRLGLPGEEVYMRQLALVRENGYAYNAGEITLDTTVIAAPVLDGFGNSLAVVALRAPDTRLPKRKVSDFSKYVVATAQSITDELKGIQGTMAA